MEPGKQLVIQLVGQSEADKDGIVNLQFMMNGTPRSVAVKDKKAGVEDKPKRPKALDGVTGSVAATMPSDSCVTGQCEMWHSREQVLRVGFLEGSKKGSCGRRERSRDELQALVQRVLRKGQWEVQQGPKKQDDMCC